MSWAKPNSTRPPCFAATDISMTSVRYRSLRSLCAHPAAFQLSRKGESQLLRPEISPSRRSMTPHHFWKTRSHQKSASMGCGERNIEEASALVVHFALDRRCSSLNFISMLNTARRTHSEAEGEAVVRRGRRRNGRPQRKRQRTTKAIRSSGHPRPSRARESHCRAGRPTARLPLRQSESNRGRHRP